MAMFRCMEQIWEKNCGEKEYLFKRKQKLRVIGAKN
jgi:hypothetical protein